MVHLNCGGMRLHSPHHGPGSAMTSSRGAPKTMQTYSTAHQPARAFLGMSHSPLIGLNPLGIDRTQELEDVIERVRSEVTRFAPELVILIGPDHYNGFFNELMPPFCIGSSATAVGDFLTPAGQLRVSSDSALALADHLMDEGFDIAVSRRMLVDHGFAQALQFLWGGIDATPPVIPIFLNAVARPGIPRVARCRQLGVQIGRFLDGLPSRTLVIGSGGLSHEPPVPTLDHVDPAVRERILIRRTPTPEERDAKTRRVMDAGMAFAAGTSSMKQLNPAWDQLWMDAMESGDLEQLLGMTEADIESQAGLSANESKTWLVARAAAPSVTTAPRRLRYYRAIPELIAGYGALYMGADAADSATSRRST